MEMTSYTSPRVRLKLGQLSSSQYRMMITWCQERWGPPTVWPAGPREWTWYYHQGLDIELDLPSAAAACEFRLASPHE